MPTGRLVLFPTNAPRRRRRIIFVVILFAALLSLTWPVYPFFSGTYPLLFGFPLSLAWVVGWLFVVFAALVWLYRSDHASPRTR